MSLRTEEITQAISDVADQLYVAGRLWHDDAWHDIRCKPLSRSEQRVGRHLTNMTDGRYVKIIADAGVPGPALHDVIEVDARHFMVVGERNTRSTLGSIYYPQVRELADWVEP